MNALWVAHNTFREATRGRVLAGMVVAGIGFLLAVQVLTPLALGEGRRLVVDLGLSSISMLGLLVVLTVGTSLVAKEIERRTIFNLLARPIARPAYLVGKWAGLTGAVWVIAAVLGAALQVALLARGERGHALALLEATFLAGLELSVVTAVAVMFSALSSPVLSALYTLAIYCVGQWSYDLRSFALQFPPALRAVCETVAGLVPNLPVFNMRALAADGLPTSWLHLAVAAAYAALYCGCVLALGAVAFEKRDFR